MCDQAGLKQRHGEDWSTGFSANWHAPECCESAKLTGYGNFQLRDNAERLGRAPKAAASVNILAPRVPPHFGQAKSSIPKQKTPPRRRNRNTSTQILGPESNSPPDSTPRNGVRDSHDRNELVFGTPCFPLIIDTGNGLLGAKSWPQASVTGAKQPRAGRTLT